MQGKIEQLLPEDFDWQQLCRKLQASVTLTALVLTAWQMGLWFAKAIVEQQLTERAQVKMNWGCCSVCGTHLLSKGFVKRQMLTLVGEVKWKRRVGRCPRHCSGSHKAPFDEVLDIHSSVSTNLNRTYAVRMPAYRIFAIRTSSLDVAATHRYYC